MNEEVKPGDIVYTDGVGYGVVVKASSEFNIRFWHQKWEHEGFYDWDRFDKLEVIGQVTAKSLALMPDGPVEDLAITLGVNLRRTIFDDSGFAVDTEIYSTDKLRADILKKLQEQE